MLLEIQSLSDESNLDKSVPKAKALCTVTPIYLSIFLSSLFEEKMRRAHCTFLLCFAFIFAVLSKADQPINKFRPHVHEPFSPGLIQQAIPH
ncbi:hypothetical protein POTOM_049836 [Populus tomentosa]|uniref:Uncharacterized protein n=1 Tax=Populus tomentosa TaxID=118781 RepID=A0A8X7YD97_POPTO|nr:hypothetical protein POTOM_049836 [Populus tomentosa]